MSRKSRDLTKTPLPVDPITEFFAYDHLPPHLQEVSRPFKELVDHLALTLPPNEEHAVALRKLLEAKDCAVRAELMG
ncbi:hypothetical protein Pan216_30210 [Planctomycetes bacterium Pan216]|uniref:Uncharacterized protein n=1 Tax=Kolteria novifilia TaxID=2527975 RepID=A0A518B5A2_9BACT|nr:hypothetical protein Pan216_30210 [Planctomycetes bacterium Pan216]